MTCLLRGLTMFFHWLRKFFLFKGLGVSILVPFHCADKTSQRIKNWHWLRKYWRCHFPWAEIIVGEDPVLKCNPELPFSKSQAINNAASRAHGDVFVIVDADGYILSEVVRSAVKKIRQARRRGHNLWFVPYRYFFRLTEKASKRLLDSSYCHPYKFPMPPDPDDVQDTSGSQLGHWYGAGIQIMSREAFEEVGGWDPRFRGWGGEDHAAMRAMDTLYWRHKTMPAQFLHLWHPMFSPLGTKSWVDWRYRMWANQDESGANDVLSGRYYGADGDRKRMRKLLDEGVEFGKKESEGIRPSDPEALA